MQKHDRARFAGTVECGPCTPRVSAMAQAGVSPWSPQRIDWVRGAGRGCPPRLPILASRAPRRSQRPPAGRGRARRLRGSPRRASPPRAGSEGSFAAAGGRRGRRDRRPPQLPRACGSRGDASADGARVERGSGAGAAPTPPARTAPSSGYLFAAESFSQSLAAIVSSGPNREARASWISAALPTTTMATASGGGMSFAATSATCSGVTAATRSR